MVIMVLTNWSGTNYTAESQLRSQSGVKLVINWNASQNTKCGVKLSPVVWGIYMLNLRAQHYDCQDIHI